VLRWRGLHIHVWIVAESRMGVMVENLDLLDLREQPLVESLNITGRQGVRLRPSRPSDRCDK